jgi:hypothetical protein
MKPTMRLIRKLRNLAAGAHAWQGCLIGVLLLAWGLNTHGLGGESVWTDEGLTLTFASGSTWNILPLYSQIDEYHPPVHYLAWHFWIGLVGRSEFAIRALSALAGLLTIALVSRLGRAMFGNATGLAAGLLTATSGFQVYYAQTVRVYSLLELLSLWSFSACYSLTRRFSTKNMAAYALINVLLLYTHLYSGFVLVSQNVFVAVWLAAIYRKSGWPAVSSRLRRWVFLQITLGLAFLGWAAVVIFQFSHFTTTVAAPPPLGLLIGTFIEFTWSVPAFVAVVCILVLSCYAWLRSLRQRGSAGRWTARALPGGPPGYGGPLLTFWLLGVFGVPVAVSLIWKPVFLPRYGIPVLPAYYLLTSALASKRLPAFLGAALVGAVLVFQLGGVQNLYQSAQNEDWRAATAFVDARAQPGDWLLFYSGWAKGAFDYYTRRSDLPELGLGYTDGPERVRVALESNPERKTVWMLLTYADPSAFAPIFVQHGYRLVLKQDYFRIALWEYQKVAH